MLHLLNFCSVATQCFTTIALLIGRLLHVCTKYWARQSARITVWQLNGPVEDVTAKGTFQPTYSAHILRYVSPYEPYADFYRFICRVSITTDSD